METKIPNQGLQTENGLIPVKVARSSLPGRKMFPGSCFPEQRQADRGEHMFLGRKEFSLAMVMCGNRAVPERLGIVLLDFASFILTNFCTK